MKKNSLPSRQALSALFGFGLALQAFVATAANADVILGAAGDVELNEGNTLALASNGTSRVGASSGANGGRNFLLMFQLPDLGLIANPFATADLGLYLLSLSGAPTFNVDLYALGTQDSATLTIGSGALSSTPFYEGPSDGNSTLIQTDFITPSATLAAYQNTNIAGDAALLAFLNTAYAGGANIGDYVVFRVNADVDPGNNIIGYNVATANASGTSTDPILTYTAVPEPSTAALLFGGFVAVLGLKRTRRSR